MLNIDFTFVWTGVNLLILYLFLKKVLFNRVGDYMEKRSKAIEEDMEKGKAMQAEAEKLLDKQKDMIESAGEDRRRLLSEAREKAAADADVIIAGAKEEAARLTRAAREETAREQERMAKDMRDEVASLALLAASKVIEANMDTEKNRELVGKFLEKEGVA